VVLVRGSAAGFRRRSQSVAIASWRTSRCRRGTDPAPPYDSSSVPWRLNVDDHRAVRATEQCPWKTSRYVAALEVHAQDCLDCETKEGMLDVIECEIALNGELSAEQRGRLTGDRGTVSGPPHADVGDQDPDATDLTPPRSSSPG